MTPQQHDQILKAIGDLPSRLAAVLSVSPLGGTAVGPSGTPASGSGGGSDRLDALQNLGFAAGRFAPAIGQLASHLQNVRNLHNAWGEFAEAFGLVNKPQTPPGPPTMAERWQAAFPAGQNQPFVGPQLPPQPSMADRWANAFPPGGFPPPAPTPVPSPIPTPGSGGSAAASAPSPGVPPAPPSLPRPSTVFGGRDTEATGLSSTVIDLQQSVASLADAVRDLSSKIDTLDREDAPEEDDQAERAVDRDRRSMWTGTAATSEEHASHWQAVERPRNTPRGAMRPEKSVPSAQGKDSGMDLGKIIETITELAPLVGAAL